MVRLPGTSAKYRCLGPCGELYSNQMRVVAHRKGSGAACKGAGWDIEFPDELIEEVVGGTPSTESAEERKDPDQGLPVADPPAPAGAGGKTPPTPFTIVGPSTTKDTIFMPAAAHTLYDTIRGSQRFRYEGSFNDLVVETYFEYWRMLGVEVAVIVREPRIQKDGSTRQEEKAHA